MEAMVGQRVVEVLEDAAKRFLDPLAPEAFKVFVHHLGKTDLDEYDGRNLYWRRLQKLLDSFFTASERAEICDALVARLDLVRRPEAYDFLAAALAERRLQKMRAGLIPA